MKHTTTLLIALIFSHFSQGATDLTCQNKRFKMRSENYIINSMNAYVAENYSYLDGNVFITRKRVISGDDEVFFTQYNNGEYYPLYEIVRGQEVFVREYVDFYQFVQYGPCYSTDLAVTQ
jgi:hypothetical protein